MVAAVAQRWGPAISGWARKVPTWVVYLAGTAWAAWIFVSALITPDMTVQADPAKYLEHRYGIVSLQLLLAGLCVTPLLRFARINLIKFRRALGLLAFLFLALHFLVWLVLDMALRWSEIGADLVKRPYIVVGFVAFLLLIPLAVTSWNRAMKAMSSVAWQRLHRLVYVAVVLGAVHFVMQEKVWTTESLIYLALAVGLVGLRATWIRRW
ncbi:sulfoxide reductase heme-binding subunit YedZ [Jannaschia sp. Os4]|uniref:ferric reductase-like transmembrane domain-containing protein n=1 Tax=Jannaschia sp. Os4 TaxID=2807617 RepID=UPI00193A5E50|nr:sulfoxide reductase heme-binding subunit YedZ [Jannaschia sp. Os4]